MLVVLTTHPGDRHLTVPLCEHIHHLGGVTNHECLIVSPVGTDMKGIEDVLRGAFGNVWTHQYAATMQGWPYGPNEAASAAMMHVWLNPALRYHYLMLEPDCVPNNARWLDHIDAEYRRTGALMLGVRMDTIEIDTGRIDGRHTVGVAVYPKIFPQICPLVKGLLAMTQAYYQQKAMPKPWDAYFGPYTSKMTAETNLIQHLVRDRKQTPAGVRWDCRSIENALSQVRPEVVLIHGSKDPAFLPAITGRKPDAPIREVPRHSEEKHPIAPAVEAIQWPEPIREAPQDEEKPLTAQQKRDEKSRQRLYKECMEHRKLYGFSALPFTPEYTRSIYFAVEMPWPKFRAYARNLGANGFGKGNTKGAIIDRVIAIEKEQRKEPWTAKLPQERAVQGTNGSHKPVESGALPEPATIPVEKTPLLPVGSLPQSHAVTTAVVWNPVDPKGRLITPAPTPGGDGEIPPHMREKMRNLIAARNGQPV